MPTLAAYPGMMQRARKREGLRVCRAAWLVGVSVREYREIEAGDRIPSLGTYERLSELYGWPQTFVGDGGPVDDLGGSFTACQTRQQGEG